MTTRTLYFIACAARLARRLHVPVRAAQAAGWDACEWVDWYCHRRLHGEIGHVLLAEYETTYYRRTTKPQITVTP
ncbi:hypothetical protein N4G70_34040 [Streptomyces sp. ASQP_92]|uniref:hypothetical protein n=1 Tax=Streptomyces sp. ASQP_92 TaxID=2979116 RepID=UPI0021C15F8D|nr:hypothetical protein [Streptomyces sp. ASQP_92]MCT9093845.1 hypothetical protein [Streptomyces sp. ASQP_92]